MSGRRAAGLAVALVILFSIVGTVFRVATAPERVKARREVALATCTTTGGEWVTVGQDELCRRVPPTK
jgi:hypothetical protein